MKKTITFLLIIALCSCGQEDKGTIIAQTNKSEESIFISQNPDTNSRKTNKITDQDLLWEKQQDSLRSEILKKRDNKVLKESFFQEFYIRNVARVVKDSLLVTIPFNLHGPDCGAPDCYSTDVSFSLLLVDSLIFPERLPFREHEHGCVEKETKISGSFHLIEQTGNHIIYHSNIPKRTLVLFSPLQDPKVNAMYFTRIERNRINGKNVYNIFRDFNENDNNSVYPFTSWILITREYENFLSNE